MKESNLEFEKPIFEVEKKIAELKKISEKKGIDVSAQLKTLEQKLDQLRGEVLQNLTAWQRVQIARHPQRPYTLDLLGLMTDEFIEFHGDRRYGDDRALIGGVVSMGKRRLMVVGHQKG